MTKILGYIRETVEAENELSFEIEKLIEAGVLEKNIFIDGLANSSIRTTGPQLKRCLESLSPGDMLVVWKLDRIGGTLIYLSNILSDLYDRNISFRSISEDLDTSVPTGKMIHKLMGAVSDFEKALKRERTLMGYKAAKERGGKTGRKNKLSPNQQKTLVIMYRNNVPIKEILAKFDISKSCFYKYLHKLEVIPSKDTIKS